MSVYGLIGILLVIIAFFFPLRYKPKPPIVIPEPKPEPQPEPVKPVEPVFEFNTIPTLNKRISGDSLYADIINRCNSPYLLSGKATNAHETTHEINSVYRNTSRANAFFMSPDKIFICSSPNIKKHDIIKNIPAVLRDSRFDLYVKGQVEWDDTPLYVLDEWVAYINGCEVYLVDNDDPSLINEEMGPLDMGIFAVALYITIEQMDEEFLTKEPHFKDFILLNMKRTHKIVHTDARNDDTFPKYLLAIRNDPSCEALRGCLNKNFESLLLS